MTLSKTGFVSLIALSLVIATGSAGRTATPQCNAELRNCNSHCNLVYESKRSNRVCRERCKDKFYVCKARPA